MDETTRVAGGASRRVLSGRYVLRGLLGQGGMADVELAYDEVLDRQVAVKILHQRYSDDPSFLERFKREARAAASLNHPNMVAVYDTGEQDGRPFIVMEYVPGRSLRDVLRSENILPGRAAEIAGDAAMALHYAHDRGLVHRDIKPANIMLSDEGQVKVTDFGIARAMNAETVTQTAAVFGTAAYISPEQAQGATVDRRTDIYSLGVVLYELLTGRQPFTAESAVGLAYKHVSEDPIPPAQLNEEVSPPMEAVVMKAMAKNPDNRYPDARSLAADLERAAQGQAVSAPPVMAYALTQALTRPVEATGERHGAVLAEAEETERPHRGRRAFGFAVLALLILALFALAAYLLVRALDTEPVAEIEVPDVTGQRVGPAQRTLREEGFQTQVAFRPDPEVGQGRVIETTPGPGSPAPQGSLVSLVVSTGTRSATVPTVVGLPEPEAEAALRGANLSIGKRREERSDEEPEEGTVIAADPPEGTEVAENDPVRLTVSAGPATVLLPDVRDQADDAARQTLRRACGDPPCVEI
nr:Stk1 family PASTA domain-containing Ser/Thr kinase [Euzebyales bacterium]